MKSRSFTLTLIGALLLSGAAFAQHAGGNGGGNGGSGGVADAGSIVNMIKAVAPGGPSRPPRGGGDSPTGTECRTLMQFGAVVDGGAELKCRRF